MSHPGGISLTLGIVGDGTSLHEETRKQLEGVLGEHFICRNAEPTDTSADVLVVVGEGLLVDPVKEALLAGFPSGRIVVVTRKLHDLQAVCLDDLDIPCVIAAPRGNAGSAVVAHIRSALGHAADPPVARARIEETLGQLGMQRSETFRGLALKQRLTAIEFHPPGDSGLNVSVIRGRERSYPFFGSCPEFRENMAIVHATGSGLSGLGAKEHALFTQALVCQCAEKSEADASLTRRFVRAACSILGTEETYRPALLIFKRSFQTLEVLLTGNLDLWLVNPKRLPPVGVTPGPGVALSGTEHPPSVKERRIKLTNGDHLLLLDSGWFTANETNRRVREEAMLEAAASGDLPAHLKLNAPDDSGSGIVIFWNTGGVEELLT